MATHFSNIDLDGDMGISVEEATLHVDGRGGGDRDSLDRRPDWFSQIDRNDDGVIQPVEFDEGLDEEHIAIFAGRK